MSARARENGKGEHKANSGNEEWYVADSQ
jgi:hypothetical protein